jgi:K+-sensing histidine kinase KdpD
MTGHGDVKVIVVGTNGTVAAAEWVRRAAQLAAGEGARLTIVSAYSRHIYGAAEAAACMLQRARAEALSMGAEAEILALPGRPSSVLRDVARRMGVQAIVIDGAGRLSCGA